MNNFIKKNWVKMKSVKNKSKLSRRDEEFDMINISNSRNSDNLFLDSDDYLTLSIKKKNIEFSFVLKFYGIEIFKMILLF